MKYRLFFIGVLIFAALALSQAPASLLASVMTKELSKNSQARFSYAHVSGLAWKGRFDDVVINSTYIGRVDYDISLLALLTGKIKGDLSLRGGAIVGDGKIVLGKKLIDINGGNFRVALGDLTSNRALGVPLTGQLRIEAERLRFNKKGCVDAKGTIFTDFLHGPARQLNVEGFNLQGPASCKGDDLELLLSGSGSEGRVGVELLIKPDLHFQIVANVVPVREEVVEALAFAGFEKNENGLNYQASGNIAGAVQ